MFSGIFFYLIYINMKYDNPHRICLVPGGASSFIIDSKKVSCSNLIEEHLLFV